MRLTVNNIKLPINHNSEDIKKATAKALHMDVADICDLIIRRKSIDAREKDSIKYVYSIDVTTTKTIRNPGSGKYKNIVESVQSIYNIPDRNYYGKPVIVGAGPAGLFCAFLCVEAGVNPIIIERGAPVEERIKDVELFWNNKILKPDSNVQYGEGGAGTFSDGKLNTLVKDKKNRCRFVLETFVRFGAPEYILYDAKPHVGTDVLMTVVRNMREYLLDRGAELRFHTKLTGISYSSGNVTGVIIDGPKGIEEIDTDRIVLAIGHSARDTFEWLCNIGIKMDAKPFAVGLRVEHPQLLIDKSQYGIPRGEYLPAAAYKLTGKSSTERGVYSFCMCPGGYVVNASSEDGLLAVNGMSYSKRDGKNANSAIIVTVTPEDYDGLDALAGVRFQRELERKAYELGEGCIPIQSLGEYLAGLGIEPMHRTVPDDVWEGFSPQNKGDYKETDLHALLPKEIGRSLAEGMQQFGAKIYGFDDNRCLLSGVESRTSSPVRIWRNDNGESPSLAGLYPCGEGAGYAGGITSAAMDGMFIAEQIISTNI